MLKNLREKDSELENYLENCNFPVERKGKELFDYWKNLGKEYLVNTSASLIFYNPANAFTEYFFGGMTLNQVWHTREVGSTVGLVSGYLYAGFRKRLAKILSVNEESSQLKKGLTEISAAGIFALLTYPIVLKFSEQPPNYLAALSSTTTFAMASAIPYGYYLDKWRNFFGFKPLLRK